MVGGLGEVNKVFEGEVFSDGKGKFVGEPEDVHVW